MVSRIKATATALPRYNVQVLIRQRKFRIFPKAVADFCAALLSDLGQSPSGLAVTFVGSRRMRQLNLRYRKKNYATDVLSFSYDRTCIEGVPFLGDIVISVEKALEQALSHHVNPEKEVRKLLLHGVLHLLGYDHEQDRGEMIRLQRRMMRRRLFDGSAVLADLKCRSLSMTSSR
jgi:probable rRNA maturation factor